MNLEKILSFRSGTIYIMEKYLKSTEVIDWKHPAILDKAKGLAGDDKKTGAIVKNCFEWVRDEIKHSYDFSLNPVTCKSSDVLKHGTGFCFSKSHLLVALLRAQSIHAGLCYQKLSRDDNGPPYTLHGLAAAFLPETGWYRMDPRGNRKGINAQFLPPIEQIAFNIRLDGEADIPGIWSDPLPIVVDLLNSSKTYKHVWEKLPQTVKNINF